MLTTISQDEIERRAYKTREMQLHDEVSRLEDAREETREEKREETRQRDIGMVLKLLNRKFSVLDETLIEKVKEADSEQLNFIIEEILDIEKLENIEK